MVTVLMIKLIAISFICITLAGGCIGTGILFAGYIIAVAKNPEESDNMFSSVLMGFALIETFVFISLGLGVVLFIL